VPEEDLVATLAREPVVRAVPELLQTALRRSGSMSDNVTGLAITWQGTPEGDDLPTAAGSTLISTETLPGDLHSTTIAPADPFDEAEIDKAIAEIRGAIERSSQLLK
jgi:protein phosphatase